jgi:hypothetical protein
MTDPITALRSVLGYLALWIVGLLMMYWGELLLHEPVGMSSSSLIPFTAFVLTMAGVALLGISGAFAFVKYFQEVDL